MTQKFTVRLSFELDVTDMAAVRAMGIEHLTRWYETQGFLMDGPDEDPNPAGWAARMASTDDGAVIAACMKVLSFGTSLLPASGTTVDRPDVQVEPRT